MVMKWGLGVLTDFVSGLWLQVRCDQSSFSHILVITMMIMLLIVVAEVGHSVSIGGEKELCMQSVCPKTLYAKCPKLDEIAESVKRGPLLVIIVMIAMMVELIKCDEQGCTAWEYFS